jgi:hypothetical protein
MFETAIPELIIELIESKYGEKMVERCSNCWEAVKIHGFSMRRARKKVGEFKKVFLSCQ